MRIHEVRLTTNGAPNIGVSVHATRRHTSTFIVGGDGVTQIMFDGASGVVAISTDNGESLLIPITAVLWMRPEPEVLEAPVASKSSAKRTSVQSAGKA